MMLRGHHAAMHAQLDAELAQHKNSKKKTPRRRRTLIEDSSDSSSEEENEPARPTATEMSYNNHPTIATESPSNTHTRRESQQRLRAEEERILQQQQQRDDEEMRIRNSRPDHHDHHQRSHYHDSHSHHHRQDSTSLILRQASEQLDRAPIFQPRPQSSHHRRNSPTITSTPTQNRTPSPRRDSRYDEHDLLRPSSRPRSQQNQQQRPPDSPSLSFIDRALEDIKAATFDDGLHRRPTSGARRRDDAHRRPPDSPSLSDLLRPDQYNERTDPLGFHHHHGVAATAANVPGERQLSGMENAMKTRDEMPESLKEMQEETRKIDPLAGISSLLGNHGAGGVLAHQLAPGQSLLLEQDSENDLLNEQHLEDGKSKHHERWIESDAKRIRLQREEDEERRQKQEETVLIFDNSRPLPPEPASIVTPPDSSRDPDLEPPATPRMMEDGTYSIPLVPRLDLTGVGFGSSKKNNKKETDSSLPTPTLADLPSLDHPTRKHPHSSNTVECTMCHDSTPAEVYCQQCDLDVCKQCDVAVHHHLASHIRMPVNALPSHILAKRRAAALAEDRLEKKRRYQQPLRKIEPAEPFVVPPRTPPSPVALFDLQEYIKEGHDIHRRAEEDFFSLAGVCAVCQVKQATMWCVECQITLCSAHTEGVDAEAAESNTMSCDGQLHHADDCSLNWHTRIAFDPAIHKRKMRKTKDHLPLPSEVEEQEQKKRGEGIWLEATPPPSLPPTEPPSPRTTARLRLAGYGTGDNTTRSMTGSDAKLCEVCESHSSVLFCNECRLFLCQKGGCDIDLHPLPDEIANNATAKFVAHERVYLANGEQVKDHDYKRTKPAGLENSFVPPQAKSKKATTKATTKAKSNSKKKSDSHTHTHTTSNSHKKSQLNQPTYSRSATCEMCRQHRATRMCLDCEMNFCEGGSAEEQKADAAAAANGTGTPRKVKNCDQLWHQQEATFRNHKRKAIDEKHVKTPLNTGRISQQTSARSIKSGTGAGGSISSRLTSSRSHRASNLTGTSDSARVKAKADSEEDEILLAKQELADLRAQKDSEERLLEVERRKLEEEERRLLEEERQTVYREDRAESARRRQEEEENPDEIQLILRAQRKQARTESEELEVRRAKQKVNDVPKITPRSLPRDHPDFDPLGDDESDSATRSCESCAQQRADIYCRDCKKYYCSHPMNQWDLKTPRQNGRSITDSSQNSPPQTSRSYPNCDLHIHNIVVNSTHSRVDLPHFAIIKKERREKRMKEREAQQQTPLKGKEKMRERIPFQEVERVVETPEEQAAYAEAQLQQSLLAREAKRAERVAARDLAIAEREQRIRAEQEVREKALYDRTEQEHAAFLDGLKNKIKKMRQKRDAAKAEEEAEQRATNERRIKLLAQREAEMQNDELERWRILRQDSKRKRLLRAKNLTQLKQWNARKRVEEERHQAYVKDQQDLAVEEELAKRKEEKKKEEQRMARLIDRAHIVLHKTQLQVYIPTHTIAQEEKTQFQKNLQAKQEIARLQAYHDLKTENAEEAERAQEALLEGQLYAREELRKQREKEEDAKIILERRQKREWNERVEMMKKKKAEEKEQQAKAAELEKQKQAREEKLKMKEREEKIRRAILERDRREEMAKRERIEERKRKRQLALEKAAADAEYDDSNTNTTTTSRSTATSIPSLSSLGAKIINGYENSARILQQKKLQQQKNQNPFTNRTIDENATGRDTIDTRDLFTERSPRSRSKSRSRSSSPFHSSRSSVTSSHRTESSKSYTSSRTSATSNTHATQSLKSPSSRSRDPRQHRHSLRKSNQLERIEDESVSNLSSLSLSTDRSTITSVASSKQHSSNSHQRRRHTRDPNSSRSSSASHSSSPVISPSQHRHRSRRTHTRTRSRSRSSTPPLDSSRTGISSIGPPPSSYSLVLDEKESSSLMLDDESSQYTRRTYDESLDTFDVYQDESGTSFAESLYQEEVQQPPPPRRSGKNILIEKQRGATVNRNKNQQLIKSSATAVRNLNKNAKYSEEKKQQYDEEDDLSDSSSSSASNSNSDTDISADDLEVTEPIRTMNPLLRARANQATPTIAVVSGAKMKKAGASTAPLNVGRMNQQPQSQLHTTRPRKLVARNPPLSSLSPRSRAVQLTFMKREASRERAEARQVTVRSPMRAR